MLSNLFNFFLNSSSIPTEFKSAIVTPLFKKGAKDSCDNYRGISVLSPIAKIFERILYNNIIKYFNSNNLFTANQHGFRTNHSCETALHSIIDNWKNKIDANNVIMALFIDFKKAFDLVDQRLLFLKLFHYGFSNSALNLMKNYFAERTQKTKINSVLSESLPIELGVPQGSLLGPLLFIIFINDMAIISELFTILFADDTTVSESASTIETVVKSFSPKLKNLLEWTSHNRLHINWSKTKCMILTGQKQLNKPSVFKICASEVEIVTEFKLLGVLIDQSLSFDSHINLLKLNVNRKLFSIKKIFFLSKSVKIHFFKTFILPHFDYCATLCIFMCKTLISKIEKLFNNCLFILSGSNPSKMSDDERKNFFYSN